MVPRHTASLMVKLKVKHMGRLYVMVCLPVVSTGPGLLVAVVGPLSCPFSLSVTRDIPSLSLHAVAAVALAPG